MSKGSDNISYIYSATGTKLAMLNGTAVDNYYAGTCVYKGDRTLDYALHPEGVVRATAQGLSYEYFLRDHLGSTRVVFSSNGAVLQTTDYYAFGMAHAPLLISNANGYLYNGKEQQGATLGGVRFDWYDYGRRMYDPQLGVFHTQDRFAEKYMSLSPYQYAANNPIGNIDVNGDSIWYTMQDNVITMHVTGKVFNTSSDNINTKRAASDIASGINAAFSGEFNIGNQTYTLQTDIQLEAASSMENVADSDHLFNIVDADGEGSRGAANEMGGKVINVASVDYANDNWFSNTFSWNNTRSAVHEFGHTAGLAHESASGSGNLLTQKGVGTNVTSEQRRTMMNAVINKGTNSYMGRPYPYIHGFNSKTLRWEKETVHRVFNPSYYRK